LIVSQHTTRKSASGVASDGEQHTKSKKYNSAALNLIQQRKFQRKSIFYFQNEHKTINYPTGSGCGEYSAVLLYSEYTDWSVLALAKRLIFMFYFQFQVQSINQQAYFSRNLQNNNSKSETTISSILKQRIATGKQRCE